MLENNNNIIKEPIQVAPEFFAKTFRNCGYTLNTAISDIVDNSLEKQVDSSNVIITTEYAIDDKKHVKTVGILIIDDGKGMSFETLQNAMKIGGNNGKSLNNYGYYGTGLKSAAISLGKTLEVFSLEDDEVEINYAKFSLETGDVTYSKLTDPVSDEYKLFFNRIQLKDKNANSGTVVRISDLDSKDLYVNDKDNREHIVEELGLVFNKIILDNDPFKPNIWGPNPDVYGSDYVEDILLVQPIFPVPFWDTTNKNVDEIDLQENNQKLILHSYYIPSEYRTNGKDKRGNNIIDATYIDDISKQERTARIISAGIKGQGFYIYRNNRLVGRNLTLGLFSKHPSCNAFRAEIFIDGHADKLFNSTFTKTITDKALSNETISAEIEKLVKDKIRKSEKIARQEKAVNASDEFKQTADTALKECNDSRWFCTRGKNTHHNPPLKNKSTNDKATKTGSTRNRTDTSCITSFDLYAGDSSEIFGWQRASGKNSKELAVSLNNNNNFYKAFFSRLGELDSSQIRLALSLMIMAICKCEADAADKIKNIGCCNDPELFEDSVREWYEDYLRNVAIGIDSVLGDKRLSGKI